MITITESGMIFGLSADQQVYQIEKSDAYTNLGEGIKVVESVNRKNEELNLVTVSDVLNATKDSEIMTEKVTAGRVCIQTFGRFEVFVDRQPVAFGRPESKELLAVLIDKRGVSQSRPEIFSKMWEDQLYDRAMQVKLDVIIRSMRSTLAKYGIDTIFEKKKGYLRVRPEQVTCDAWQLLNGDLNAINAYQGEYMRPYAWAGMKEEYLKVRKRRAVLTFVGQPDVEYCEKLVTTEKLAVEPWRAWPVLPEPGDHPIEVRTFGGFDVMVHGELVMFGRAKSKELLAFLVDRCGTAVSRKEASSVLWEGKKCDRALQKQLDVVIRSLYSTLREYGISEIVETVENEKKIRIVPELLTCDLYRYLNGEVDAVQAYCGEYMDRYSWASLTEAYLDSLDGQVQSFIVANEIHCRK